MPVQHHVTGSAVHPEASAREHTVGAAGKQSGSQEATLNGTTRPVERRAAAGAGSGGEGLGEGRGATEGFAGASLGREHAGELEEVVRWCAPKVAWEHLRLQLNVRSAFFAFRAFFRVLRGINDKLRAMRNLTVDAV